MSRFRTTIDSVTKAVGSADFISRFSRLKPGSLAVDSPHVEKVLVTAETITSNGAEQATQNHSETQKSKPDTKMKEEEEDEKDKDAQSQSISEKTFVASKKSSTTSGASASVPNSSTNVAKQTLQIFHPTGFSSNMDETYKTLATHINSYFGSNTATEDIDQPKQGSDKPVVHVAFQSTKESRPVMSPVAEKKSIEVSTTPPLPENLSLSKDIATPLPSAPVPSAPSKKGFTHYLSYPRPSVQAFVGSYIAPLVPKFRSESKAEAAEKDKTAVVMPTEQKPGEKIESEEEKKEKAKQLLISQREKIIARVSVDNRTRALVKGLQRVTDIKLLITRVEELSFHLLEFPETRGVAIKSSVLPTLLRLRQAKDLPLQSAVREALAVVGYTDPVKGRGIRVLAIDGGGTRGLLALQTLNKLENLTGKRVHELFDYICGVSTGAILAFMLGIFQIPLEECEQMYRKLGSDVFKQNVILGTVKMGWSHAFYDSEMWESILKERLGEGSMIESARDPHCPKVSAVSTIVNRGLPLKAYVFRNYRLMPGVRSHYLGDCKHKMWQAIRASSAAPGYFQEFVLGKDLHQDGGLLINNPTALAIHECKNLWPNTPLQCVLSLGTGRYEEGVKNSATYTSLKTKLTHVISSATDTEEVHTMLDALLPPDTYFRFNPYMSEDIPLNESRIEKLNFLKSEAETYLERNEAKLKKAAMVLGQEKGPIQRVAEWAKLKADMYEGLPFLSKL
ncbi:calcium-independent phospholipase A2-gamma [Periophthalmus magnuspinnatus]|uniref:calcium-independent phospholipase A2-gamma n=1 Tax=Periophthalmus magnuspinnatus TaxID=409849 RepID=UPI00145A91FD|nr:calcium-independent phospholipase A2-gamma [Periophthalmus magnuspinnatus]